MRSSSKQVDRSCKFTETPLRLIWCRIKKHFLLVSKKTLSKQKNLSQFHWCKWSIDPMRKFIKPPLNFNLITQTCAYMHPQLSHKLHHYIILQHLLHVTAQNKCVVHYIEMDRCILAIIASSLFCTIVACLCAAKIHNALCSQQLVIFLN